MPGKAKNTSGAVHRARLGPHLEGTSGRLGQRLESDPGGRNITSTRMTAEPEEDTLSVLQRFYDYVEADPQLKPDLKDTIARILAGFYHREEPGFTLEDAYQAIVRDYRQISEEASSQVLMPEGNKAGRHPPTLKEVLAGSPFSPRDFMGATPPLRPGRRPGWPPDRRGRG